MKGYRVSFRRGDGVVIEEGAPDLLRETPITVLTPWRLPNNHRGQNHQTGLQYLVRSQSHVPFESRLEQFAVQRLGFDPAVLHVAAQPFLLTWTHENRRVGHVPDLLALRLGQPPLLIDVKPRAFVMQEPNQVAFSATAAFARGLGWEYAVWSEPSTTYLLNLRYLEGFWRVPVDLDVLQPALLALVRRAPRTIGELAGALEPECLVRPVLFHLLWSRELTTDLELMLDDHRILQAS